MSMFSSLLPPSMIGLLVVQQSFLAVALAGNVNRSISEPFPLREQTTSATPSSNFLFVYIGTYTNGDSKGIYRMKLNLTSGALSSPKLVAESVNPSFLAVDPKEQFLFAVNEVGQYMNIEGGAVSAFSIDSKTGNLTFLNHQTTQGADPCHLVVDAAGKHILVANYSGGSVAVLPFNNRGQLGAATSFVQHIGSSVNSARQSEPHAHSINLSPDNRYALAADLGTDEILIYQFDSQRGQLTPNDPAAAPVTAGAGPRHFAFHPNGQRVYVINELASSITVFRYYEDRGALETLQEISTLPKTFDGSTSTAEIQVHPSGNFVYGSNRGHDSIAIFSVNPQTGTLLARGHVSTGGQTPRNFTIDPTGRYLLAANQSTNDIFVFAIDPLSGDLESVGKPVTVPSPVCIRFIHPE